MVWLVAGVIRCKHVAYTCDLSQTCRKRVHMSERNGSEMGVTFCNAMPEPPFLPPARTTPPSPRLLHAGVTCLWQAVANWCALWQAVANWCDLWQNHFNTAAKAPVSWVVCQSMAIWLYVRSKEASSTMQKATTVITVDTAWAYSICHVLSKPQHHDKSETASTCCANHQVNVRFT